MRSWIIQPWAAETDAPPFLNCGVEIQTSLGSHNLLHHLLDIEKSMGRVRKIKWRVA